MRPIPQDELQTALDALEEHGTRVAGAKAMGISVTSFKERIDRARAAGLTPHTGAKRTGLRVEGDDNSSYVVSLDERLRTVEDVLKKAEIDMRVWRVDRQVVNYYEQGAKLPSGEITVTPLWQVKVWLKRRDPLDAEAVGAVVLEEIKTAADRLAKRPKLPAAKRTGYLYEISVPDLHIGKLAWEPETGEDYNSTKAAGLFRTVVQELTAYAETFRPERYLLPVGNDLFHSDTITGTTTAGTAMDLDTRWQRVFRLGYTALVDAILELSETAPVDIITVPGNHDRQTVFYLGEVLAARFHKDKRVSVDCSPRLRKYVTWGGTLLGFTHGDEEKRDSLESVMIREMPEAFASAAHREWHLGHEHKRREVKYIAGDTHGGTIVRILPSMSGTDEWHYRKGYVLGPRAAEGYLWHKTNGYCGHFSANVPRGVYEAGAMNGVKG